MIEDLRRLSAGGHTAKGLNLMFDVIDDLLLAGDFDKVDAYLVQLDDFDWMPPSWPVGVLTITLAAKDRLKERTAFWDRTKSWLTETKGVEETALILQGLE